MTSQPIVRKEIWREAIEETAMLIRFIEVLCLVLQNSTSPEPNLSGFAANLLNEQVPFNQHMQTIHEKDEKGAGITLQEWKEAENLALGIASRLMTLQDALEKGSPEATVLEGAGQHLEIFSKLIEQLRRTPDERVTLNTTSA